MQYSTNRVAIRGFTLLELMTTITIAGIVLGIAVPNMRTFLQNNRLSGAANDWLHGAQTARTEAIKRQQAPPAIQGMAVICATADATVANAALTCSYGADFRQWFVFWDANRNGQHDAAEAVFNRGIGSPTNAVWGDNQGILCYDQTGFAGVSCGGRVPTRNISLCDDRGNTAIGANSTARAIMVTQTGHARVSQLMADVTPSMAATGVACP